MIIYRLRKRRRNKLQKNRIEQKTKGNNHKFNLVIIQLAAADVDKEYFPGEPEVNNQPGERGVVWREATRLVLRRPLKASDVINSIRRRRAETNLMKTEVG